MKIELKLPRKLNKVSINDLMDNVLNEAKEPLYKKVEINFLTLNFIEPAGVVALDNMISWLTRRGVEVSFRYLENIENRNNPIKYLDDSGFFQKYLGKKLVASASLRPTTIPLQNVTYEESYAWLRTSFTPWLANQLGVKTVTLGNIEMCLGEIFNNIQDHSSENIGCLYAQHFPNISLLTFCIADFGVGIPHNIRKCYPEMSDAEALSQAIIEGFTTRTTPRNLGAGLHTMIKNVVVNLKGTVHINSGYGILEVYSNGEEVITKSVNGKGFYPGTFLEFNINTNEVLKEDLLIEEEEFLW